MLDMEGNYTVSYEKVMILKIAVHLKSSEHHRPQDQGSIQFLYDITDIFLRPIIDGNLFPEGFLTPEKYPDIDSLVDNLPQDIVDNYEDVINQNMNFISAVAFGIIFAILRLLNVKRYKLNFKVIFSLFMFFGMCCNQCCCKPPKRKQNDQGKTKIAWMVLTSLFLILGYLGVAWLSVR